jgi:hypothetical protein
VARVRLYLDHPRTPVTYRFIRPGGHSGVIDGLRLVTFLDISHLIRDPQDRVAKGIQKGVIDTGSHLTIFPEQIWQFFNRRRVTWLPFDPATPPGMRLLTIAGGTFPFELGEVNAVLRDMDRNALPLTFVAKFVHDGGRLPIPTTVGLRGGVLDGRVIGGEPDPADRFGQGWWLADP